VYFNADFYILNSSSHYEAKSILKRKQYNFPLYIKMDTNQREPTVIIKTMSTEKKEEKEEEMEVEVEKAKPNLEPHHSYTVEDILEYVKS